jgi:phosphoribosylglycinamide formyltransferase-1
VLAGFLRLLLLPEAWVGRVLNIHPALLPAFGGKGYWGERVHRAVLERGVQFTGCTVHYVTNEYDAGPIVLQRCVAVRPDDTVASLAARVFEQERRALPEAIRLHLSGAVRLEGGRVRRASQPSSAPLDS